MSSLDTGDSPAVAPSPAASVLALPSPTATRFVVLIAAMLTTGLFLGVTALGAVDERDFVAMALTCLGAASTGSSVCASGEQTYAVFAVGGAVLVAVAAAVVVMAAPIVIRRCRALKPPTPGLEEAVSRVGQLAGDAGLRRVPTLLVGPIGMRDPFCFGRPGQAHIAVPKALAIRPDGPLFDPVLHHELAHIRAWDVSMSWVARSVWYVLGPLMLVPLLLFLLTGDLALLPDYLWRAVVFAVVVYLAVRSAAVARARR